MDAGINMKKIHEGHTEEWPPHTLEIIKRNLTPYGIRVYTGTTTGKQCGLKKEYMSEIDLLIKYNTMDKVFLVWNTIPHQFRHAGKTVTFCLMKKIQTKENTYRFVSHHLSGTNGSDGTEETVAIISPGALYDFCVNIEDFLGIGKTDWQEEEKETYIRLIDTVHRLRRNPEFRQKVLDKNGCQCAVCGERDRAALEAAHIVAVKDGGSDEVENGICLCATHHKLYDAGKLDIDLKEKVFHFTEQEPSKTYWWDEAKKRGNRLLIE